MIYGTVGILFNLYICINALPIPIQHDQTTSVVFGVLVCIGAACVGACVCCHKRRKRGFELSQVKDRKEFENESGAVEGARTTEFPIFRALTPGQNQEPLDVGPAAVIIPVNRNVIPDEPEFDNNNVPISSADMENIENNNAIDYIPNRNEVAAVVSAELPDNLPEPVSPSRSVYSVNRNFSENSASAVPNSPFRPYQTVLDIETDVLHCRSVAVSSMSPSSTYSHSDSETNPFIGYAAVELVDIHIDMDGGESMEEPLLGLSEKRQEIPFTSATAMRLNNLSTEIVSETSVLSNPNVEVVPVCEIEVSCNEMKYPQTQEGSIAQIGPITAPSSTDLNSVEEALRALDFAISGEDSLLHRDDSAEGEEDIKEDEDRVLVPVNSDTIIVHDEEPANGFKNDEPLQHVREIAETLVAGILVECQQFVNALDYETESENPQNDLIVNDEFSQENKTSKDYYSQESQDLSLNTTVIDVCKVYESQNDFPIVSKILDEPCLDNSTELNESIDFERNPNFVASTPFHGQQQFDGTIKPCLMISPIQYDVTTPSPSAISTYNADSFLENDCSRVALNVNDIQIVTSLELRSSVDSEKKSSHITIAPPMPTIKIISECDATSEDLTTATPVNTPISNTPIELNYNMDTWDKFVLKNMSHPVESILTTSFDVQEPCTSAQALAREAAAVPQGNVTFDASPDSANNSGWFLHPQSEVAAPDGTFNLEDNIDNDYLNNDDNEENLNLTFDALRKQLAEALPHAQGSMAGPQEFSDDDDDEIDVGAVGGCGDGSYEQQTVILPQKEMVISYKRALSPIMEESEDDISCKTFVLNETKCLDSTSTGCLEGEAMGVTKTLMASNDTLFNFEDTLGDRDDMFSPRTPSASQMDHVQSSRSSSSSIYECRTPTGTGTVSTPAASTDFSFEEVIARCDFDDEIARSNSIPNDDTVNESLTFATGAIDLLSPDQQKTFSEDLSAAADATFTTTTTLEEKTCISVPLPQKDGLHLSQVSEPEWGSSMLLDMSLEDIPSLNAFDDLNYDSQDQCQLSSEDLNATVILSDPNTISSVLLVVDKHQQNNDLDYLTAVTSFGYQTKDFYQRSDANTAEKENTNPNDVGVTKLDPVTTVTKVFFEEPDLIRNCSEQTFQADIRFSGPSTELMSTSFSSPSNEWDSDVDESNSSEEFMFVKGPSLPVSTVADHNTVMPEQHQLPGIVEDSSTTDIASVWNTHHDKVPVSSSSVIDEDDDDQHNGGTSDEDEGTGNSNNSSSDAEGEWVPSCWDSMAQPARSAMKSPDKSSSEEDSSGGTTKKRRSVAFKKQHYHSVYEYPKEVSLSPAYSAPHMSWSREFGGQMRLFDGSLAGSAGAAADLAGLDGFTVSSSSRPFHSTTNSGSQFNAQNHTWPTSDSDFSWSQVQEDNEAEDGGDYPTYSELQIKWPKGLGEFFCSEDVSDAATSADNTRPDSGVGESAELLSESISLGDLCHTKASLRLPLNFLPTATTTNGITAGLLDTDKSVLPIDDEDAISSSSSAAALSNDVAADDDGDDEDDIDEPLPIQNHRNNNSDLINTILPTPSCTGSMDSLSSSSCSERQLSFTTFGKANHHNDQQQVDDRNRLNEIADTVQLKPSLVLIEDEMRLSADQTIGLTNTADVALMFGGKKITSTKQNDSTDEDSGIESIMRISKERSVNY